MANNPGKTKGTWAWLLQRVTAVLILVFLGIHLYLAHFANLNDELLSWENVETRVQALPILIVDYGLLITAIFHALNGLRMVGFDFIVDKTKRRVVDVALWGAGIVAVFWGLAIFAPFLGILGFS
jgi:succinate dehydrogenase hydrophobic anchor subunit